MNNERIEIALSKTKLSLLLAGSLAFVAVGLWLIIHPPHISYLSSTRGALAVPAGIAAVLLFGFFAILIMRKLSDNKPGLVIDAAGIDDNSGGLSAGRITWSDIQAFSVAEVQRQKFILVIVNDPLAYAERQTSAFRRKAMELNHKYYGTTITISANGLRIKLEELLGLLNTHLEAYRKKSGFKP